MKEGKLAFWVPSVPNECEYFTDHSKTHRHRPKWRREIQVGSRTITLEIKKEYQQVAQGVHSVTVLMAAVRTKEAWEAIDK
ncbi:hypothetical protein TNCV_3730711 [Trichonephila clavipes]|nr:hypothetical protein TNCV_3730711 [Trichonephila clavipes]